MQLTRQQTYIVDAIRHGRTRPHTIARDLKTSDSVVSVQLYKLVRLGVVVRVGRGVYALPPAENTAQ